MKMQSTKRAIDKIYKRRDRYEIPDWQREEVWDKSKRQKLIDSILRSWKLPKFYFLKTNASPEEFEVVDGQQRLNAIFDFFEDILILPESARKLYGGIKYSELSEHISDFFDDYEIEYDEIIDAEEQEVKEFFQRLQEGMRLTASEKLNSEHSKLRDFCVKLANHNFFNKKVAFANKRYAFFDITSKVAALELEGVKAGFRFKDVKNVFQNNKNFSEKSASAKRLEKTLYFLDNVFKKKNIILKNRLITQSVITFGTSLMDCNNITKYQKKLENFLVNFFTELTKEIEKGAKATDKDMINFQQSLRGNIKDAPFVRQTILMRKFIAAYPEFALELDPTHSIKSSIVSNIEELAKEVKGFITIINEHFNAKTGIDFFKTSTKTFKAANNLENPIKSYDDYKSFISDLYFLFWEGPSSKLTFTTPTSFKEINCLRTELQHDLDHGKPSKSSKKKKEAGQVFNKYSGFVNPKTIEPEMFQVFQLNILQQLNIDLNKILKNG